MRDKAAPASRPAAAEPLPPARPDPGRQWNTTSLWLFITPALAYLWPCRHHAQQPMGGPEDAARHGWRWWGLALGLTMLAAVSVVYHTCREEAALAYLYATPPPPLPPRDPCDVCTGRAPAVGASASPPVGAADSGSSPVGAADSASDPERAAFAGHLGTARDRQRTDVKEAAGTEDPDEAAGTEDPDEAAGADDPAVQRQVDRCWALFRWDRFNIALVTWWVLMTSHADTFAWRWWGLGLLAAVELVTGSTRHGWGAYGPVLLWPLGLVLAYRYLPRPCWGVGMTLLVLGLVMYSQGSRWHRTPPYAPRPWPHAYKVLWHGSAGAALAWVLYQTSQHLYA